MDKAGLDQRALANALDVNEGTVSHWFNDKRNRFPAVPALVKMPEALGVTLDWLMGVPGAAEPSQDKVRAAVHEALRRARGELRAEMLRVFDEWADGGNGGKRRGRP